MPWAHWGKHSSFLVNGYRGQQWYTTGSKIILNLVEDSSPTPPPRACYKLSTVCFKLITTTRDKAYLRAVIRFVMSQSLRYTGKNVTDMLQVVDFTSLLQVVNKLQQVC